MLAVAAVVLSGTISPAKAFGGFANASVLLVVIAFLVAQAVVKSGLGERISPLHGQPVSATRRWAGLQHRAHRCGDRAGVSFQHRARRRPVSGRAVGGDRVRVATDDPEGRRLGGYLMYCAMASLAVSSALWMTATSANPIGHPGGAGVRLEIGFGKWLVVASVPALTAILLVPRVVAWLYPPGVGKTPDAPVAARKALAELGRLTRDERITAVVFVLMVSGWIFADRLGLNVTSIAFAGLGLLLLTNVLTVDDIAAQGDTLATFSMARRPVRVERPADELGFMGYAGQRLRSTLGGLSWPATYVTLSCSYVAFHYMFVSQSSQVLALLGVFLDVGIPRRRAGAAGWPSRCCSRAATSR